ncbi:MAG: LL-diaminopimelate aminotransferase [Candidatus Omnitrophica bacterium]|nr:LL-diaminopimelate aminotransferase [Candidatus Omnitrophota bacterium]
MTPVHSSGPIPVAQRLTQLPPYLFAQIDAAKRAARAQGRDLVDLGVGDPDQPTPAFILQAMAKAIRDPKNHRYALDQGMPALRETIAEWYLTRFRVKLDPATEILPLIGSKEGIAHLPLAFVNPGDSTLVPDPCYPPYRTGTILAGGTPIALPLREENDFLPDISGIRRSCKSNTKILYLNYPNNPTGATATLGFFKDVAALALQKKLLVAHDAAYSELAFDGLKPPSFLQVSGAKEVGIEFHSLSKTYNMTGWRIGWACGNAQAIAVLGKVKSNVDSGIFQAIQVAGIAALKSPPKKLAPLLAAYQRRRAILVEGLRKQGWPAPTPKATFYLWTRIPKNKRSAEVAQELLRVNVVATPGNGFGEAGEGYIRMAMTVPEARIREAVRRMGRLKLWSTRTSASARI